MSKRLDYEAAMESLENINNSFLSRSPKLYNVEIGYKNNVTRHVSFSSDVERDWEVIRVTIEWDDSIDSTYLKCHGYYDSDYCHFVCVNGRLSFKDSEGVKIIIG